MIAFKILTGPLHGKNTPGHETEWTSTSALSFRAFWVIFEKNYEILKIHIWKRGSWCLIILMLFKVMSLASLTDELKNWTAVTLELLTDNVYCAGNVPLRQSIFWFIICWHFLINIFGLRQILFSDTNILSCLLAWHVVHISIHKLDPFDVIIIILIRFWY